MMSNIMCALFLWPILVGLVFVVSNYAPEELVRCFIHHAVYCFLAIFLFSQDVDKDISPFLGHALIVLMTYRIVEWFPLRSRHFFFKVITFMGIITYSVLVIFFFENMLENVSITINSYVFNTADEEVKSLVAYIGYWIFQSFRYPIEWAIKSLLKFIKSKFK
jgi:hypothetical protein